MQCSPDLGSHPASTAEADARDVWAVSEFAGRGTASNELLTCVRPRTQPDSHLELHVCESYPGELLRRGDHMPHIGIISHTRISSVVRRGDCGGWNCAGPRALRRVPTAWFRALAWAERDDQCWELSLPVSVIDEVHGH
jgi:hypothetical protein